MAAHQQSVDDFRRSFNTKIQDVFEKKSQSSSFISRDKYIFITTRLHDISNDKSLSFFELSLIVTRKGRGKSVAKKILIYHFRFQSFLLFGRNRTMTKLSTGWNTNFSLYWPNRPRPNRGLTIDPVITRID